MIYVLVSGGIDSLAAARLLREQQPDVTGLHLLTGYNELSPPAVAQLSQRAGIPVETLDCRSSFESAVVKYFVDAYCRGETPNPCIRCNMEIKFGMALDYARQQGVDTIATGHYCRIMKTDVGPVLRRGKDAAKDQSYFLAFLSSGQLQHSCFPLGAWTKEAVREMAAANDLAPVLRKESQDICFIPPGTSYGELIQQRLDRPPCPGEIEDMAGNIIGSHPGVHRFTIGQRRGINCPARVPYYVAVIDVSANRIRVGTREQLLVSRCRLRKVNWLDRPGMSRAAYSVQVRYQHCPAAAAVEAGPDDTAVVVFDKPQFGITPGQGAVLYTGDQVAGAGIIAESVP